MKLPDSVFIIESADYQNGSENQLLNKRKCIYVNSSIWIGLSSNALELREIYHELLLVVEEIKKNGDNNDNLI